MFLVSVRSAARKSPQFKVTVLQIDRARVTLEQGEGREKNISGAVEICVQS